MGCTFVDTDCPICRSTSAGRIPMMISVCIPTIRPDTVADAISSIRRQTHSDWELIVIGQGDEQVLRAMVESAAGGDARVRYVHLERTGLSIARNAGVLEATGELVAFTDDDCEARDDWLARIADAFDRDLELGVVVGSLLAPETARRRLFRVCPEWVASEITYHPVTTGRRAPERWGAAGGNICVRTDVLRAVGAFDEHLGAGAEYPASEDTDYLLRVELLGVPMRSSPDVVVHHTHGYRYGFRAVYRHRRNYATGNGALAAKLSLLDDERGPAWRRSEIRAATLDPFRKLRPQLLPVRLVRLAYFLVAYRSCCRNFAVQDKTAPVRSVLRPRHQR